MSFTKEKRESIKRYMLEKISSGETDFVRKTAETFFISDKTVYKYLEDLTRSRILTKNKRKYSLTEETASFSLSSDSFKKTGEDIIYAEHIYPLIKDLPDNVIHMWNYAFTEMMNNVIDHSDASNAVFLISRNYLCTRITIKDNGIGIFKKIKEHYQFDSLQDAVTELFKGKLTTDSAHHSGEGIFFTSRIMDVFAAVSDGLIFTHDKYEELAEELKNIPGLEDWQTLAGTIIYMELSNFSKKTAAEIFDQFADADGGFTRTRIPVKHIFEDDPVSRSQAKRLCRRFESFHEVELDFLNIGSIGQGFAHELFVVFTNSHPSTKLIPVNTSDSVRKMIQHVLNSV